MISNDSPPPRFVVRSASGGESVFIAAKSPCVLDLNERIYDMKGGSKVKAFKPEADKLIESGAPVWIA